MKIIKLNHEVRTHSTVIDRMLKYVLSSFVLALTICGCTVQSSEMEYRSQATLLETEPAEQENGGAKVTAVMVSDRIPGSYRLSVTINSPDTGCDQYANWWEVIDEDGNLLYRRILAHSHIDEQPFTRDGGPISVNEADQVVIVRVHMSSQGYSDQAMQGSASKGFKHITLPPDFFAELAEAEPQPNDCAF